MAEPYQPRRTLTPTLSRNTWRGGKSASPAPSSVVRLRLLTLGAGLPAAVDPQVLGGVRPHHVLDRPRVALRDVAERVADLGRLPVAGVDDVLHADPEAEGLAGPAG